MLTVVSTQRVYSWTFAVIEVTFPQERHIQCEEELCANTAEQMDYRSSVEKGQQSQIEEKDVEDGMHFPSFADDIWRRAPSFCSAQRPAVYSLYSG